MENKRKFEEGADRLLTNCQQLKLKSFQYNDSLVQPVEEGNKIQRGRFNYVLTFLVNEELSEIEKIHLQRKIQERLTDVCSEIKSEYPVRRWLIADDEVISDNLKGFKE